MIGHMVQHRIKEVVYHADAPMQCIGTLQNNCCYGLTGYKAHSAMQNVRGPGCRSGHRLENCKLVSIGPRGIWILL